MPDLKLNLPVILIILVIIAAVAYIFYKIHYTKKKGIETDAIITAIEDEDLSTDASYTYYVRYSMNGQTVEAKLSNPGFGKGLEVGAQIRIKYLPEKPKIVVWVR